MRMSGSDPLASSPNGGPGDLEVTPTPAGFGDLEVTPIPTGFGDLEVTPTLVTGFGPFGSVTENPSAALASSCGKPFQVLEVSFEAVDEFVDGLDPSTFERLLLIGVHGGTDTMRLEVVARNEIGSAPDVRGVVAGPGPIYPRLPRYLSGGLWDAPEFQNDPRWSVTTDAGTYLCNYIYFKALSAFPGKRVGFLHVPSFEKVALRTQTELLRAALEVLDGELR